MTPDQAAQAAARRSYGRLLSWLAWQWRDIAAAEDALADAFVAALERWPADGVPASPDGWLMAVAKRNMLMVARRQRLADDPAVTVLWPSEHDAAPEAPALPDSRLRLMFVCTHPAIDPAVRSALMMQTILGLDAGRIASAFLVKPEAMTKRLVRAKAKIKSTGIRFEEPGPDEWPERLGTVLEAIYGGYTLHWGQADEDGLNPLAQEAMYLAELLAAHVPQEPEALGLLALLWLCEARRPARLDAAGNFVPLDQQDTARWDGALIARASQCLIAAARLRKPGPYQLEAAIQAAHAHGCMAGAVPWSDIAALYEQLLTLSPTAGARIGHAVAVAMADTMADAMADTMTATGPQAGLALLQAMAPDQVSAYQPWWAALAHLSALAGDHAAAQHAYGRALALATEPAVRAWLMQRMDAQAALAQPG